MVTMDVDKIKLVIWDLDDTFWKGTLSEEEITPIEGNINLIKGLTERGIVNSICSKNDEEQALVSLKQMGVEELFVFNSINWLPKGQRVAQLIKDMGLRPANVLFLDDNYQNLQEAKYYSNGLMIGFTEAIEELKRYVSSTPETDITHKRLKQYIILERKQHAKACFSSNTDFLFDSDTRVEIGHDCLAHVDRIHELLMRSNQLNYTKVRVSKEQFIEQLKDSSIETGYVSVKDRYGDYGIIGFYAKRNKELLHFFFSCRTIGQGVEQYVYAKLGYPKLKVNGDVISEVTLDDAPAWINQRKNPVEVERNTTIGNMDTKILLKGPCDLYTIVSYLKKAALVHYEFDYVSECRNNLISQQSHSLTIVQSKKLSEEEKEQILTDCPFTDKQMFCTKVYDNDYNLIFLSTLRESSMGIYRNKTNGLRVAFGKFNYPMTDEKNWELYLTGKIDTQQNVFTEEYLRKFSLEYEFEGKISLEEYKENILYILNQLPSSTKLCFMLGAEKLYEESSDYDIKVASGHKEINDFLRQLADENEHVLLLDVNQHIHSFNDYTDRIEHYTRMVYYKLATDIVDIISRETGKEIEGASKVSVWLDNIVKPISSYMNHDSALFKFVRKAYFGIRGAIFR